MQRMLQWRRDGREARELVVDATLFHRSADEYCMVCTLLPE